MFFEIALSVTVLVFVLYKYTRPPSGLPPGEWGLPIIGSFPSPGMPLGEYFANLTKKHGKIFHVKLGSRILIVITDYQQIKAAFNNPDLQGRADFFTFRLSNNFKNLGLVFSEDEVWQNGRRFALRHLKEFGMGKSILETTVQREATALIEDVSKEVGQAVEVSWNLNVAILNIIWSLVADRRYEVTDPEIQRFSRLTSGDFDIIQGPVFLLDMIPWLVPLVPKFIKNSWMQVNVLENNRDELIEFFMEAVKQHKDTIDPNNPRDYIDSYLLEMENQKKNKHSTFYQDYSDLMSSMGDLFVAGSETTSSTLRWVLLFMAKYPEVQKKIQEEIDEAIPRNVLPSMSDKDKLVYFEATLLEIQRKATLTPFGGFHAALVPTSVSSYSIPERALVMAHIEAVHNDPTYWEKPEEFYPEHFLDQNGKLVSKKEGFLPFSVGRRQCLGESLAKMELFLFSAALLQKFTITAPPGVTLSTDTDRTKPFFNFVLPYKVIFTERL